MPRKGTKLSHAAAERQASSIAAWHKANTEILKFSVRVPKGCSGNYRELARRRGQSLTSIVRDHLDALCREEGIQ